MKKSKAKKPSCPMCGQGHIRFQETVERVPSPDGRMHKVTVRVGICDVCAERVWPRESLLIIERLRNPEFYRLDLPADIVDHLVREASRLKKNFKTLALERLSR